VTISQKEFQRVKVIDNAAGGRLSVLEERLFVPLLVQDATDRNTVDGAADAGHRAECARRGGTCDADEGFYFEVVSIYQRHLAGSAQADRQRAIHDNLAAAQSGSYPICSARMLRALKLGDFFPEG